MSNYPKDKLIRNLRPGEEIELRDATVYPTKVHRVRVTRVRETERGFMSGQRQWRAYFTPQQKYGTWCFITGYSNDKITVYSYDPR
jgi:hypothetical protein